MTKITRNTQIIKSIKHFCLKYQIECFFLLAFAFTWSCWLLEIINPNLFGIFHTLGVFGPFLAAIILTSVLEGKKGLKIYFKKFKISLKGIIWLLGAVGLLTIITISILFFHTLTDGKIQNPYSEDTILTFITNVLLVLALITLIGGGNEEPGWRGYALPLLQDKYGPWNASLILGFMWGIWHVPLWFIPDTIQQLIPFHIYLIFTMGLSVLFTWLYNNAQSITLIMIFHGWVNVCLGFAESLVVGSLALPFTILTILIWCVAFCIIFWSPITQGIQKAV